jgi:hypothetical protein
MSQKGGSGPDWTTPAQRWMICFDITPSIAFLCFLRLMNRVNRTAIPCGLLSIVGLCVRRAILSRHNVRSPDQGLAPLTPTTTITVGLSALAARHPSYFNPCRDPVQESSIE